MRTQNPLLKKFGKTRASASLHRIAIAHTEVHVRNSLLIQHELVDDLEETLRIQDRARWDTKDALKMLTTTDAKEEIAGLSEKISTVVWLETRH